MTKIKTFACLLLIICSYKNYTYTQNVGQTCDTLINYKDINGFKQGLWEKKHYNGKIKYRGNFVNNKPVGDFKRYDIYGNLTSYIIYDKNGVNAEAKFYYKGNVIAATGYYYEKTRDSIWKYYDKNKILYLQESFKKGVKHGKFLQYNNNKIVIEEKNYKNGIENGKWIKRYMNGNMLWESNYVNGKLEGKVKAYYESGKLHKEGNFKNDLMHGTWLIYNEKGNLIKTYNYKNGHSPEADFEEDKRMKDLENNKGKYQGPKNENDIEWLRKRGNY